MYLSKQRYEEINIAVYKLFRDYNIKTVPIDIEAICLKMGIKLIPYSQVKKEQRKKFMVISKDGFSYLNEKEKCYYIYYNSEVQWQRTRFTIMHEIGHIVLGHSEYSEKNEAEANFFSRSALAPIPLLLRWEIEDVEEIVSTFDISYEAAKYISNNIDKRKKGNHSELQDYELALVKLFEV